MKIVSKQKLFEEGNKRFWCAIHIPSLNPTSFLSPTFSRIPKNSIQATHNSPHLIGLQAHLMDHITIASASVPLSHRHRDNDVYRKKQMTQKQVTQVLMPPNKENHYFYIFPIWSTHHLGNSTQSLLIHMKKYFKILR